MSRDGFRRARRHEPAARHPAGDRGGATANYDLPPDVSVAMINLSENATYKIEAPDGRRWALRIHRDGYHSRTAIASELAWLVDLRQTRGGAHTHTGQRARTASKSSWSATPDWHGPAMSCCRSGRAASEPGIGEELSQPFEVLGEVTARMHLHARQWKRPSWFTRHSLGFRDKPRRREPALGPLARRHGRRRREGEAVRPHRRSDRHAARRLRQGRRPLRPHPLRPPPRQSADRRQRP